MIVLDLIPKWKSLSDDIVDFSMVESVMRHINFKSLLKSLIESSNLYLKAKKVIPGGMLLSKDQDVFARCWPCISMHGHAYDARY